MANSAFGCFPSDLFLWSFVMDRSSILPPADVLADLSHKVGASPIPSLARNPAESIPLFCVIKGSPSYRAKLDVAARDLFRQLRGDPVLKASVGDEVIANGKPRGTVPDLSKAKLDKYVPTLKILLHSLSHVASIPVVQVDGKAQRNSFVAIPLGDDQFRKGAGFEAISHTAFKGAVMCLTHLEWLELAPMYYCSRTGTRFRTRIRPLGPIKDWMLSRDLIFHRHPVGLGRATAIPVDQLLRVNIEGEKTALDRPLSGDEVVLPELNKSLRRQRLKVSYRRYEDFEASYDFREGRPRYWPGGQKDLYRVFSGEDGRGGRLYGHWVQQIPGRLRQTLTIDGKPTVELDYSGMQLALLYARAGRDLPSAIDLYAVPGQRREDMKLVLTRSVGNPTRAKAIQSIQRAIRSDSRYQEGMEETLYDAFWSYHKGLSPEEQGMGAAWAELQAMDSKLALSVLANLHHKGVTAIPIHDSFIVKAVHEGLLRQVMIEEFENQFGMSGIQVK